MSCVFFPALPQAPGRGRGQTTGEGKGPDHRGGEGPDHNDVSKLARSRDALREKKKETELKNRDKINRQ